MKNIIIINDYCYVEGGASKVAITSAVALAERGIFNVVFIGAVGPVCKELAESRISRVYSLSDNDCMNSGNKVKGLLTNIYNKALGLKLQEIMSSYNPADTLIHVHTWTKAWSSAVFDISIKKGFRIAVTAHDYFLTCPNGGLFNFKKLCQCDLAPLSRKCIVSNCDSRNYLYKTLRLLRISMQNRVLLKGSYPINVIFISDYSKTHLKGFIPFRYGEYFLNDPIDIDYIDTRAYAEMKEEYVFLGRVAEEKGVRLFCEAISKADVKGTVIGAGPLYDEMVKSFPSIKFLGWKDKSFIREYLTTNARAIVFASLWGETLGMTVLEAQAYGVPSITADKTATCDNVDEGVTGLIFKNGNLEELSNALLRMQDDELVASMSKNCFDLFDRNKWGIDGHVNNLENIYHKILN